MWAISKRILGWAALAGICSAALFGESASSGSSPAWLRTVLVEIRAACRDPGTQWMVFACCAIYFITFTVLTKRGVRNAERGMKLGNIEHRTLNPEHRTGHRSLNQRQIGNRKSNQPTPDPSLEGNLQPATFNLEPADWCLCGLLLIAALHYAFNYDTASGSTQALMLMAGAAMGKGARLWASWGSAERGVRNTEQERSTTKLASQARLQMASQGDKAA